MLVPIRRYFTVFLKPSWTWSDLFSQTCTRQRLEGNKSSVFADGSSCIAAVGYKNSLPSINTEKAAGNIFQH